MRKGQVEFIAIIGILAVVVVAAYFAFTSMGPSVGPSAPTYTSAEQSSIGETVNSFIKDGASETLRTLSAYGGYLEPQANSVTYLGKEVPYWMKGGQSSYPDLRQNLVQGLTSYISSNKANLEESLASQGVSFGAPAVSVTLMASQMVVSVSMPTTYKGGQMPQPYVVTVPTKISEVYDFSKAFAEYQKSERFFEWATISSMMISPIKEGVNSIPIWISETGCGLYIYRDINDVRPYVQSAIETTLAHTYMPGKVPLNIGDKTSFPKYGFPPLDGNEYADLGVSFALPDGFELGQESYQMSPNPITVTSQPIPMTGLCYSNPVFVKHFVSYPMVVVVKDTISGDLFRFATEVFIKDNEPGEWSDTGGYQLSALEELCQGANCQASIVLKDQAGTPVEGARVTFMGCGIGTTDVNGAIQATAPCGVGSLDVSRGGQNVLSRMYSSGELVDAEITVPKALSLNLYVYEVKVQNITPSGGLEKYMVSYPYGVSGLKDTPARVYFVSKEDAYTQQITTETGVEYIDYLTTGEYGVSGMLFDSQYTSVKGEFGYEYSLDESLDGKALYVYVPTIEGYGSLDEAGRYKAAATLLIVLNNCGLGPVQGSQAAFNEACVVTWTS